ncbi:MAG: hypothetical protein PHD25_05050 [Bacteroidales bacterium]|nr:hypothetical protein [Bacteroidales bacterium]
MNLSGNRNREAILFWSISFLLWIYIWARAICVPLIYDEIATFFHYIHTNSFLPFHSHLDANNHLLNSALTWISYKILGSSPLALRLPNVLSFPLFVFFVWKFARQIQLPFLRWSFILSMLFAHNFLEFFSLTRGYGMSMAFLLGSCWYLNCLMFKFSVKNYSLALLYGMLSVGSNLNLMYAFILLQIILVVIFIQNTRRQKSQIPKSKFQTNSSNQIPKLRLPSPPQLFSTSGNKKYSTPTLTPTPISTLSFLLLSFLPTAFFTTYLFYLKSHGALYYGSSEGLITTTFRSLSGLLFESGQAVAFWYACILLSVSLVFYLVWNISHRPLNQWFSYHYLFLYLMGGNIIGALTAHWIFGINYHESRTALYYYPLLIGTAIFTIDAAVYRTNKRWITLLALPLLIIPVTFGMNVNFSHVSFENERIPERFYQRVRSDQPVNGYPATIGGYRGREMQWAYQNFRHGGPAGIIQYSDYPGTIADYQIAGITENPDWLNTYDSLDYDPQTGFYLFKRKTPALRLPVSSFQISNVSTSEEFISFAQGSADTLKGKSLYAGYRLSIISSAKPLRAWIVFTAFDKDRATLCYERIPLDWQRTAWKAENSDVVSGLFIALLPDSAHTFVTYLWNIEKKPLEISTCTVEFFELR